MSDEEPAKVYMCLPNEVRYPRYQALVLWEASSSTNLQEELDLTPFEKRRLHDGYITQCVYQLLKNHYPEWKVAEVEYELEGLARKLARDHVQKPEQEVVQSPRCIRAVMELVRSQTWKGVAVKILRQEGMSDTDILDLLFFVLGDGT